MGFKSWRQLRTKDGKVYYYDDPILGGSGRTQYENPRKTRNRIRTAHDFVDVEKLRNISFGRWKRWKAKKPSNQFEFAVAHCLAQGIKLQKDRTLFGKAFMVSKHAHDLKSCCDACALEENDCKVATFGDISRKCEFHSSLGSGLKIVQPRSMGDKKQTPAHLYSFVKFKSLTKIKLEKKEAAKSNARKRGNLGGAPSKIHSTGPRVIDAFTFNHELDLLEIRLNELSDAVDQHILVESHHNHVGIEKPLHYQQVIDDPRFAPFKDKIVHIVTRNRHKKVGCGLGFQHLNDMRDDIEKGFDRLSFKPVYSDIIIVGDADEIPSAKAVNELRAKWPAGDGTVQMVMRWSFYGFFWRNFKHSQISHARLFGKELEIRRERRKGRDARHAFIFHQPNGGWHCSWCFRPDEFQTKLEGAVCGDGVRFGDFKWPITLIRVLIMKGIWFGRGEPPEVLSPPIKVKQGEAPEHALKHWMRFKYLLEPEHDDKLMKKKIIMPFCPCTGDAAVQQIMNNYDSAINKGQLMKLQRAWCPPTCADAVWE